MLTKERKELMDILYDKLIQLKDDDDYLIAIYSAATHPDDLRAIIDFIDAGQDVTAGNVLRLAANLHKLRNGKTKH